MLDSINKKPKKELKMNTFQYPIFLKYWGMGADRSLEKLRELLIQECSDDKPKNDKRSKFLKDKVPALETLKVWSKKFNWQEKLSELNEEANKRLFEDAIGVAKDARVDILKIFKAVVLRFAQQLRDNPQRDISSGDLATFWRMARIEMGMPADRADLTSGGKSLSEKEIELRFVPLPPEQRELIMGAFRAWGIGPQVLEIHHPEAIAGEIIEVSKEEIKK